MSPTNIPLDVPLDASNETISPVASAEDSGYDALSKLPKSRKLLTFSAFCFALFLDSFNNSALYPAIPPLAQQLNIPDSQTAWLLSAYQLTFAALLLVSGRVTDLYNPKWVFVTGSGAMAVFALVAGFMRSEIPMIVLRALMGAGAALTIPSALHMIVHLYPDPQEQALAVTIFNGMGAIGIVLGLLIGALLVSFTSWPWVFYFGSIVALTITATVLLLVPNIQRSQKVESRAEKLLRFKRIDIFGVTLFAASLILFIFAVTSGSIDGWGSAKVIAPLIISVILMILFFVWEARLKEDYAALPPKMWHYENFTILVLISIIPLMWWTPIFSLFAYLDELVYDWSAINTAVHFLPIGLGIFPILPVAAGLQAKLNLKWVILIGFLLQLTGTLLLPFGNSKERYWRFIFPGFLLGTAGTGLIYATVNVALLAVTPGRVSGIVQGVFTSALQTGGAMGVAIVTSIQTSVQESHGGPNGFQGRAAALWFIVAMVATMMVLFSVFMKTNPAPLEESERPIQHLDEVEKTPA